MAQSATRFHLSACLRRWTAGAMLLSGAILAGQSYQSSFSDVTYDRAKGPASFHGGVEVDAASGAINIDLKLGPGIGARGAFYQPVIRGRIAPQMNISWGGASIMVPWPNLSSQPHIQYKDLQGRVQDYAMRGFPAGVPGNLAVSGTGFCSLSAGYLEINFEGDCRAELPDGRSIAFHSFENTSPDATTIQAGNVAVDPLKVLAQFPDLCSPGQALAPYYPRLDGASFPIQPPFTVTSGGQLVMGLTSTASPALLIPAEMNVPVDNIYNFNLQVTSVRLDL